MQRNPLQRNRVLAVIDFVIRMAAVLVVSTLGLGVLVLACGMGTDSGTGKALAISAAVFVAGVCLLGAICFLAIYPARVSRFIPGPRIVGVVLVRIPTYLCGTAGLYLLMRQIWFIHILPRL